MQTKLVIIIVAGMLVLTGCTTIHTSVEYKPVMEAKNAGYLSQCELVIYPPVDVRLLKRLPQKPLSEEDKKRFIGGNWGRYSYFLDRPVVDVVHDAMISEFTNLGYTVIRGSGSEGPPWAQRYYLLTRLKLADATYNRGGKVTTSANIILDYTLKAANGELLFHDVVDELVREANLVVSPNKAAEMLVYQCLPNTLQFVIEDIDEIIQEDVIQKTSN
jgi:hypothetical protein